MYSFRYSFKQRIPRTIRFVFCSISRAAILTITYLASIEHLSHIQRLSTDISNEHNTSVYAAVLDITNISLLIGLSEAMLLM